MLYSTGGIRCCSYGLIWAFKRVFTQIYDFACAGPCGSEGLHTPWLENLLQVSDNLLYLMLIMRCVVHWQRVLYFFNWVNSLFVCISLRTKLTYIALCCRRMSRGVLESHLVIHNTSGRLKTRDWRMRDCRCGRHAKRHAWTDKMLLYPLSDASRPRVTSTK